MRFRPWGLAGGEPGRATRNILEYDGVEQDLPSKVTMRLTRGALITHEQAGGGGYGSPAERDSTLIKADVRDGKITEGFARERFGYSE